MGVLIWLTKNKKLTTGGMGCLFGFLPLVQIGHVDGPVVRRRSQTLGTAVDVGETKTTAQRTLAASRGQRAKT